MGDGVDVVRNLGFFFIIWRLIVIICLIFFLLELVDPVYDVFLVIVVKELMA